MPWHELCTIHFDWVKLGEPITSEYPTHVVDRTVALGADALIFGVQLGGHVCYDSRVAPKIPHIEAGIDVLRDIVDRGHRLGLKIIPMFITTAFTRPGHGASGGGGAVIEAREHPAWMERGPSGESHETPCWVSPFRDYQCAQVREVVSNYDVDGLYFDQVPRACWCVYCQEKFRDTHGRAMPKDVGDPEVRQFRNDNFVSYCKEVRAVIDGVRLGLVYAQATDDDCELISRLRDHVDAIMPYAGLGSIRPHIARAYSGKPIWEPMYFGGHSPGTLTPIRVTQLSIVEALLNRFAPMTVELGNLDYSKRRFEQAAVTYGHARELREYLADSEALVYCAVLHSLESQAFDRQRHDDAVKGFWQVLVENHLPYEIVTEEAIRGGALPRFKVLVLPDAPCLDQATVEAVTRFVAAGGGLVAEYSPGSSGAGENERLSLLQRLGIDLVDTVVRSRVNSEKDPSLDVPYGFPTFCSARVGGGPGRHLKDDLLVFRGDYAKLRFGEAYETVVDIVGVDQSKVNMQLYNRRPLFPGDAAWPLLTIGKGDNRVAFFSAKVGACVWRENNVDLKRLIAEAIVWSGGEPPVQISGCPGSVELAVYYNESRSSYVVVLVNLSGIQREEISRVVLSLQVPEISLAPMQLKLRVQNKHLREVRALTGRPVSWEADDEFVSLGIPALGLYEAMILQLG